MEITQINWQSDSLGVIRAKQELSKFLEDQPQKGKYPKIDAYNEKRIKDLTSYIQQNHTMEISTKTMQGKTGLQIEALIREAYEAGERNFTTDLPTDIFDSSSIGSTQIDADGTPYTDWGFNVGEWDLVAAKVNVTITKEAIEFLRYWRAGRTIECFFTFDDGCKNFVLAKIKDGGYLSLSVAWDCKSSFFGDEAHIRKINKPKIPVTVSNFDHTKPIGV